MGTPKYMVTKRNSVKKGKQGKNNMGKLVAFKCQFFGALPKLKIAAILKEHSKVLDPLYRNMVYRLYFNGTGPF